MIMTKKYPNTEVCSDCGGKGFIRHPIRNQAQSCMFCQGRGVRLRQDNVALNIRTVPRELRGDFKALCACNGVSMEQALISMMRRAVEEGSLIMVGEDAWQT